MVIWSEQYSKFHIQINRKLLFAISLQVENVQNRQIRIVPLVKRFNK